MEMVRRFVDEHILAEVGRVNVASPRRRPRRERRRVLIGRALIGRALVERDRITGA